MDLDLGIKAQADWLCFFFFFFFAEASAPGDTQWGWVV